jgi:hypothetical protein
MILNKTKKIIFITMFAVYTALMFTSCVSDEQKVTATEENNDNLKAAYFIDSAVEGIDYYFYDKLQGSTDKEGKFRYLENASVTFKVGNITLGSLKTETLEENSKVLPQDIVQVDRRYTLEDNVIKIATLLQSLDHDNDPENGITIDAIVQERLKSLEKTNIQDINTSHLNQIIQEFNKTVRQENLVLTHLNKNTIELEQLQGNETILKPILNNLSVTIDETPSNNPSRQSDIIARVPMVTNGTLPIQAFYLDGNHSQDFEVDTKGVIRVKSGIKLDYEKVPGYEFTCYAKNMLGQSNSVNVTIRLNNLDDEIPDIRDTLIVATVNENNQSKKVIGKISIKQEGDSTIESFKIVENNENSQISSKFEIDKDGTIYLKENEVLDYNDATQYVLEVQAVNSAGESQTKTVTVQQTQRFDRFLEDTTLLIEENHPVGTYIGAVKVHGDIIFDSIKLIGEGSALFDIEKNGSILLKEDTLLDYSIQQSYEPIVYAINSFGNASSAKVTVNITDVNYKTPVLNDLVTTLNENSPKGVIAGNIEIISQGDSPITSFTLVDFEDSQDSRSFTVDLDGTLRLTNSQIDYETKELYTFEAYALNALGQSNTVTVTINIRNLPDNYPILSDFTQTIPETAGKGYVVGKVDVEDWRALTSQQFSYVHLSDQSIFEIDINGTIQVKEDNTLDYDNGQRVFNYNAYALTKVGNTNTIDVTINLDNVADTPPILKPTVLEVAEGASKDEILGQVQVADMKEASVIHEMVLSDRSVFSIDKTGTTKLAVSTSLNRDTKSSYLLQVYAKSDTGNSPDANLEIHVVSPPKLDDFSAKLGEDITDYIQNYKFPPITVLDDGGRELSSYTISQNDKFDIGSDGRIFIKSGVTFNASIQSRYNLTVFATNAAGNSNHADVTIDIVSGFTTNAKASLGLLAGAKVELFELQQNGNIVSMYETETTNDGTYNGSGNFDVYIMDENNYYIVQVSGGVDLDSNSDGIIDTAVDNQGVIRGIYRGSWLKNINTFSVTALSEVLYSQVVQYYKYGFSDASLQAKIQNKIEGILKEDINLDGSLDYIDIYSYSPSSNLNKSKFTSYAYQRAVDNIHQNYAFEAVNGPYLLGQVETGYAYSIHVRDSNTIELYDRRLDETTVNVSNPEKPVISSNSMSNTDFNSQSSVSSTTHTYSIDPDEGLIKVTQKGQDTVLDQYQYQRSIYSSMINISDDSREVIVVTHNEITAGIMDISNPEKIILKGEMPHVQFMHDVVAVPDKNYLYLADGFCDFKVLDSSVLNQSQFSGYYSMNRDINDETVYISYDRIYLQNSDNNAVDIFDILSDIDREIYLGSVTLSSQIDHIAAIKASADNQYLYILANNNGTTLYSYDISNVSNPEFLSNLKISGNLTYTSTVLISKNQDIMALTDNQTIYFLDIRSQTPIIVGSFSTGSTIKDIFMNENRTKLLISTQNNEVMLINSSNLANPEVLKSYTSQNTIYDVKVSFEEEKIFIRTKETIKIFDLDFQELGTYALDNAYNVHWVNADYGVYQSGSCIITTTLNTDYYNQYNYNNLFVTNQGRDIYYINQNENMDLELIKLDAGDPANIQASGEKIFLVPDHWTYLRFFGDSLNHSERLRDRFYMIKNNIIYSYDLDMLKPLPNFTD